MEAEQMKLGFIGFGNMGQAIAKGLISAGALEAQSISACAAHYDKLCKNAEALGIKACRNPKELLESCDTAVIAVKPYMLVEVLTPIVEELRSKTVISIAAGWDFEKYEALLLPGTHHISTLPNIPVSVGKGIFICESRHSLTEEEFDSFNTVFSKAALIETLPAAQYSAAGTLAGCGPAFTALYIEALADAAVKYGLTRPAAYRLAEQMCIGSAELLLQETMHPAVLKDKVCSPHGTTIRGISALERNAFRSAVIEAFDAIEG